MVVGVWRRHIEKDQFAALTSEDEDIRSVHKMLDSALIKCQCAADICDAIEVRMFVENVMFVLLVR